MRKPLYFALPLLAVASVAYGVARHPAKDTLAGLELVAVTRGDVEDTVSALGKVQPRDYVDVGAQVSGQLSRLFVRAGDTVKAGDPLAEIDPRLQRVKLEVDQAQLDRLRAELRSEEVELEFCTRQFERQNQLRSAKLTAQQELDQSDHDMRSAAAKVDATKAQIRELQSTLKADEVALGYTRIYAPMAGTVLSIEARQGQTLNANQQAPVLMRIADLSSVTVWTQVSEADVPRLHLGMDVYCMTLGHGARRWTGKLRQILPAPPRPSTSGSPAAPNAANVVLYTALFDLDNAAGELKPEMSAQVFFVVARAAGTLVLPATAIHDDQSVEVVEAGGRVATRHVQTGVKTRLTTEVVSGLQAGDRVVKSRRPVETGWLEGLFR